MGLQQKQYVLVKGDDMFGKVTPKSGDIIKDGLEEVSQLLCLFFFFCIYTELKIESQQMA